MGQVELTIDSRTKDLGGFSVGRILPYAKKRMVGPFIFLDHIGPASFPSGQGMDVRPHPHIGLATVSYLFSGSIHHRDSLGSNLTIKPGEVNWMTAGRGIAHSERTGLDERARSHELHGMQSWVALPREFEEIAPEFYNHPSSALPEFENKGVKFKLVSGKAYGYESPVKIYSPMFYIEVKMQQGSIFELPEEYHERALYLVSGSVKAGNELIQPKTMPVFAKGDNIKIEALTTSHMMLLGGDPLAEARFIDWNFVSSSTERIEQAKYEWKAGNFPKVPGDDKEFIPLPEA